MLVLEGLIGLHRTIQLQLLQHYLSGHRLGPVDTPASREKLALYQAEAAKCPNLIVGGRLGEYKYYDMDQSIGRALAAATSAALP